MVEKSVNLKELERKVWTSFFEDGIWDVFIGLFFLTMGLRSITDNVWFTLLLLPALLITWLSKKLVTIPRIGYVKFHSQHKARTKRKIGSIAFLIFISILLLYLTLSIQIPGAKVIRAVFQGLALALTFVLIAHLIYFKRLYVYGILFTVGMVMWELLGVPIGPVFFIVSGIGALIAGMYLLICFLRTYPISTSEVFYGRND